jgi:hypothetical protein
MTDIENKATSANCIQPSPVHNPAPYAPRTATPAWIPIAVVVGLALLGLIIITLFTVSSG